jgi:hypothetical protein
MNTLHRPAALLLAGFAVLTVLTACTSAGTPTTATPTTLTEAQVLAIGKELTQCLRENGFPNLADPVMVDGRPEIPEPDTPPSEAVQEQARAACQPIADRLEAAVGQPIADRLEAAVGASGAGGDGPPLSPEDAAKARGYAECMREQGLAGFPDPDSTGVFHLEGTPVQDLFQQKDPVYPLVNDAMRACQQFAQYPGWGIQN